MFLTSFGTVFGNFITQTTVKKFKTQIVMKALLTLALLAVTTIASAQPGHGKGHGKGHYKHGKHEKHDRYDKHNRRHDDYGRDQRRVVKRDYNRDYNYRVERELSRYDFLRMTRAQRSRLQVSLNFLVSNGYGAREYERRLRSDLYNILSRDQYRMWENRAYSGGGNTFVFNFNR